MSAALLDEVQKHVQEQIQRLFAAKAESSVELCSPGLGGNLVSPLVTCVRKYRLYVSDVQVALARAGEERVCQQTGRESKANSMNWRNSLEK